MDASSMYFYIKRRRQKLIYVLFSITILAFCCYVITKHRLSTSVHNHRKSEDANRVCSTFFAVLHFRVESDSQDDSLVVSDDQRKQIKAKLASYIGKPQETVFIDSNISKNGLPLSMERSSYYIKGSENSNGECGYVWSFDRQNKEVKYDTCSDPRLETSWKFCKLPKHIISEVTTQATDSFDQYCQPNLAASWPMQDISKCISKNENDVGDWITYAKELDADLMNDIFSKAIGHQIISWQVLGLVVEYDEILLDSGHTILNTTMPPVNEFETTDYKSTAESFSTEVSFRSSIPANHSSTTSMKTSPISFLSHFILQSSLNPSPSRTHANEGSFVSPISPAISTKVGSSLTPEAIDPSIIQSKTLKLPYSSAKPTSTMKTNLISSYSPRKIIISSTNSPHIPESRTPTPQPQTPTSVPSISTKNDDDSYDKLLYYSMLQKIYWEFFSTIQPFEDLFDTKFESTQHYEPVNEETEGSGEFEPVTNVPEQNSLNPVKHKEYFSSPVAKNKASTSSNPPEQNSSNPVKLKEYFSSLKVAENEASSLVNLPVLEDILDLNPGMNQQGKIPFSASKPIRNVSVISSLNISESQGPTLMEDFKLLRSLVHKIYGVIVSKFPLPLHQLMSTMNPSHQYNLSTTPSEVAPSYEGSEFNPNKLEPSLQAVFPITSTQTTTSTTTQVTSSKNAKDFTSSTYSVSSSKFASSSLLKDLYKSLVSESAFTNSNVQNLDDDMMRYRNSTRIPLKNSTTNMETITMSPSISSAHAYSSSIKGEERPWIIPTVPASNRDIISQSSKVLNVESLLHSFYSSLDFEDELTTPSSTSSFTNKPNKYASYIMGDSSFASSQQHSPLISDHVNMQSSFSGSIMDITSTPAVEDIDTSNTLQIPSPIQEATPNMLDDIFLKEFSTIQPLLAITQSRSFSGSVEEYSTHYDIPLPTVSLAKFSPVSNSHGVATSGVNSKSWNLYSSLYYIDAPPYITMSTAVHQDRMVTSVTEYTSLTSKIIQEEYPYKTQEPTSYHFKNGGDQTSSTPSLTTGIQGVATASLVQRYSSLDIDAPSMSIHSPSLLQSTSTLPYPMYASSLEAIPQLSSSTSQISTSTRTEVNEEIYSTPMSSAEMMSSPSPGLQDSTITSSLKSSLYEIFVSMSPVTIPTTAISVSPISNSTLRNESQSTFETSGNDLNYIESSTSFPHSKDQFVSSKDVAQESHQKNEEASGVGSGSGNFSIESNIRNSSVSQNTTSNTSADPVLSISSSEFESIIPYSTVNFDSSTSAFPTTPALTVFSEIKHPNVTLKPSIITDPASNTPFPTVNNGDKNLSDTKDSSVTTYSPTLEPPKGPTESAENTFQTPIFTNTEDYFESGSSESESGFDVTDVDDLKQNITTNVSTEHLYPSSITKFQTLKSNDMSPPFSTIHPDNSHAVIHSSMSSMSVEVHSSTVNYQSLTPTMSVHPFSATAHPNIPESSLMDTFHNSLSTTPFLTSDFTPHSVTGSSATFEPSITTETPYSTLLTPIPTVKATEEYFQNESSSSGSGFDYTIEVNQNHSETSISQNITMNTSTHLLYPSLAVKSITKYLTAQPVYNATPILPNILYKSSIPSSSGLNSGAIVMDPSLLKSTIFLSSAIKVDLNTVQYQKSAIISFTRSPHFTFSSSSIPHDLPSLNKLSEYDLESTKTYETQSESKHVITEFSTSSVSSTTTFLPEQLQPVVDIESAVVGRWFEYNIPQSWTEILRRSPKTDVMVGLTQVENVRSDGGLIDNNWLEYNPKLGIVCGVPVSKNHSSVFQISTFHISLVAEGLIRKDTILLHVSLYSIHSSVSDFEITSDVDMVLNKNKEKLNVFNEGPSSFVYKIMSYLQSKSNTTSSKPVVNIMAFDSILPKRRKRRSRKSVQSIRVVWTIDNTTFDTFSTMYNPMLIDPDTEQMSYDFFIAMLPEFVIIATNVTHKPNVLSETKSSPQAVVSNDESIALKAILPPIFIGLFLVISSVALIAMHRRKGPVYHVNEKLFDKTYGPNRKPIYLDDEIEMDYFQPSRARIMPGDYSDSQRSYDVTSFNGTDTLNGNFTPFAISSVNVSRQQTLSSHNSMRQNDQFSDISDQSQSANSSQGTNKEQEGYYLFSNSRFYIGKNKPNDVVSLWSNGS